MIFCYYGENEVKLNKWSYTMIAPIKQKKPIGIVLWRGPSLIDGKPIAVIATGVYGKSKNAKTGDMIQTYIIRTDIHPMLARRLGLDCSVCGDCMHREQSTCYVNLCHGPINVFIAHTVGSYKDFEAGDIELFKGRNIRLGSYGDPAAAPYNIWETLAAVSDTFTGYTHQWRKCDQRLKNICMASVDSIVGYMKEYHAANKMGWRTFRIRESADNALMENEFICPASKEGGVKTTCERCGSCAGNSRDTIKCPVIGLHADSPELGFWRLARYIKIMKKRRDKKGWRRNYKNVIKLFKRYCPF